MPKDRRDRSTSYDTLKASPYACSSSHGRRSSPKIPSETEKLSKEWEEARCAVCMEHPHNAVLLICSSHDKGCRPYMCDTSYRHSNCLDQFRKSFAEIPMMTLQPEENRIMTMDSSGVVSSELTVVGEQNEEGPSSTGTVSCEPMMVCPLCRGHVKDWIVMEAARRYMNAKARSCACETCEFSGSYSDLRKHARIEHPLTRPSQADPERQRSWSMLERQRDLGDLISTLNSSFGEERGNNSIVPIEDGNWLTLLFFIRVFPPGSSSRRSRGSPARARRSRQVNLRRASTRHWGESHGEETRNEENESQDDESGPWRRHPRRTTPDQL